MLSDTDSQRGVSRAKGRTLKRSVACSTAGDGIENSNAWSIKNGNIPGTWKCQTAALYGPATALIFVRAKAAVRGCGTPLSTLYKTVHNCAQRQLVTTHDVDAVEGLVTVHYEHVVGLTARKSSLHCSQTPPNCRVRCQVKESKQAELVDLRQE